MGEIPTAPASRSSIRWTYDPPAFPLPIPSPGSSACFSWRWRLVGLFFSLRRREGVGYLPLLYLVLDLVWPSLWSGIRFLVPILPLLVLCLFRGLFWLLRPDRETAFRRRPRLAAASDRVCGFSLAIKNQATLAQDVRTLSRAVEFLLQGGRVGPPTHRARTP